MGNKTDFIFIGLLLRLNVLNTWKAIRIPGPNMSSKNFCYYPTNISVNDYYFMFIVIVLNISQNLYDIKL